MSSGKFAPWAVVMRCVGSLGILCVVAAASGCNSRPVVSGKVTYKDELLTTGEVSFISADGKSRSGLIGSDGTYEIVDAPLGQVTIVVVSTKIEGKPAKGSALAGTSVGEAPRVRTAIPLKYKNPKTSGLSYEVRSGKQTKDLPLTD